MKVSKNSFSTLIRNHLQFDGFYQEYVLNYLKASFHDVNCNNLPIKKGQKKCLTFGGSKSGFQIHATASF